MTDEQTHALIAKAKAGDIAARNRVVEAHMPLLRTVSLVMSRRFAEMVEPEELLGVAAEAMMKSMSAYDAKRGCTFRSFVGHRLRGACLDYVRAKDHVPRLVRHRSRTLDDSKAAFHAEHGREPDLDELQDASGLDDRAFGKYLGDAEVHTTRGLDTVTSEGEHRDWTIADKLSDPTTEQGVNAVDAHDLLRYVLNEHGIRAALMLKLKYLDGWTVAMVGTAFLPSRHGRQRKDDGEGISESGTSIAMAKLLRQVRRELGVRPCR